MQLTRYTDYSLRTLVFLATIQGERLTTIKEIASTYHLSIHHISKVVFELGKHGYIETVRGKYGGIRLAGEPDEINIGSVVMNLEQMNLVECFNEETNKCILTPVCILRNALMEAKQAFIDVLKQYTLQDVISNDRQLKAIFDYNQSVVSD